MSPSRINIPIGKKLLYNSFSHNLVRPKKIGILKMKLYVTIYSMISFEFCFTDFVFQVDFKSLRNVIKSGFCKLRIHVLF